MENNEIYNNNELNNIILSSKYQLHLLIKMLLNSKNIKESWNLYLSNNTEFDKYDVIKTLSQYLSNEHITKSQKDNAYKIGVILSNQIELKEINKLKVQLNIIKEIEDKDFIGKEVMSHFFAKSNYRVCDLDEKDLIENCISAIGYYNDFFSTQTQFDYELWSDIISFIYLDKNISFSKYFLVESTFYSINQYIAEVRDLIFDKRNIIIFQNILTNNNILLKNRNVKQDLKFSERREIKKENNKCLKKLKS